MKYLIVTIVLLLVLSVPVTAEEYKLNDETLNINFKLSFDSRAESSQVSDSSGWTKTDTYMELLFIAITHFDIQNTKYTLNSNPYRCEDNPIVVYFVGRFPTDSQLDSLEIGWIIIHFAISKALKPKWRKYWNCITIGWTTYDILTSSQP